MRELIRKMIDSAAATEDSSPCGGPLPQNGPMAVLGAQAVRLARVAASMHLTVKMDAHAGADVSEVQP